MDSSNIRIVRNTIALYIRMGITMLISFISVRVILHVLGTDDYGLNNVIASVVSMFGFINGSMGTAVQRFYSIEIGKKNEEYLSRVFGTGLYLHTLIAILTLVVSELFAIFFLSKLNIPPSRMFAAQCVFQISIISMVLSILNVPYAALLRAREEFSKIAVLDIFRALLKLGILYLLYHISYDKLIVLALLNLCITLLYVISTSILARKYDEAKSRILRDKQLIKKMLNFVSMLVFTVLAAVLNRQGIIVLVNIFFGLTINAAYAIAFQVSNMIETFAMNFKQSVVPQLMSSFGANNINRVNRLIFIGTKITFLLMMIITIPIMFESDFILKLWLINYPKYTSSFTILILISVNINTFSYFIYNAVHASGYIKKQQIFTSATYIISIVTIFLFFKLGSNFYYAVYIPIVFSMIRNIITIYSAKEAIGFNVKYYFKHVIFKSLALVSLLVGLSLLIHSFFEISFVRLFLVVVANAFFVIIGGYYILLIRTERELVKKNVIYFLYARKKRM